MSRLRKRRQAHKRAVKARRTKNAAYIARGVVYDVEQSFIKGFNTSYRVVDGVEPAVQHIACKLVVLALHYKGLKAEAVCKKKLLDYQSEHEESTEAIFVRVYAQLG